MLLKHIKLIQIIHYYYYLYLIFCIRFWRFVFAFSKQIQAFTHFHLRRRPPRGRRRAEMLAQMFTLAQPITRSSYNKSRALLTSMSVGY